MAIVVMVVGVCFSKVKNMLQLFRLTTIDPLTRTSSVIGQSGMGLPHGHRQAWLT
jgi:hypothetical protein